MRYSVTISDKYKNIANKLVTDDNKFAFLGDFVRQVFHVNGKGYLADEFIADRYEALDSNKEKKIQEQEDCVKRLFNEAQINHEQVSKICCQSLPIVFFGELKTNFTAANNHVDFYKKENGKTYVKCRTSLVCDGEFNYFSEENRIKIHTIYELNNDGSLTLVECNTNDEAAAKLLNNPQDKQCLEAFNKSLSDRKAASNKEKSKIKFELNQIITEQDKEIEIKSELGKKFKSINNNCNELSDKSSLENLFNVTKEISDFKTEIDNFFKDKKDEENEEYKSLLVFCNVSLSELQKSVNQKILDKMKSLIDLEKKEATKITSKEILGLKKYAYLAASYLSEDENKKLQERINQLAKMADKLDKNIEIKMAFSADDPKSQEYDLFVDNKEKISVNRNEFNNKFADKIKNHQTISVKEALCFLSTINASLTRCESEGNPPEMLRGLVYLKKGAQDINNILNKWSLDVQKYGEKEENLVKDQQQTWNDHLTVIVKQYLEVTRFHDINDHSALIAFALLYQDGESHKGNFTFTHSSPSLLYVLQSVDKVDELFSHGIMVSDVSCDNAPVIMTVDDKQHIILGKTVPITATLISDGKKELFYFTSDFILENNEQVVRINIGTTSVRARIPNSDNEVMTSEFTSTLDSKWFVKMARNNGDDQSLLYDSFQLINPSVFADKKINKKNNTYLSKPNDLEDAKKFLSDKEYAGLITLLLIDEKCENIRKCLIVDIISYFLESYNTCNNSDTNGDQRAVYVNYLNKAVGEFITQYNSYNDQNDKNKSQRIALVKKLIEMLDKRPELKKLVQYKMAEYSKNEQAKLDQNDEDETQEIKVDNGQKTKEIPLTSQIIIEKKPNELDALANSISELLINYNDGVIKPRVSRIAYSLSTDLKEGVKNPLPVYLGIDQYSNDQLKKPDQDPVKIYMETLGLEREFNQNGKSYNSMLNLIKAWEGYFKQLSKEITNPTRVKYLQYPRATNQQIKDEQDKINSFVEKMTTSLEEGKFFASILGKFGYPAMTELAWLNELEKLINIVGIIDEKQVAKNNITALNFNNFKNFVEKRPKCMEKAWLYAFAELYKIFDELKNLPMFDKPEELKKNPFEDVITDKTDKNDAGQFILAMTGIKGKAENAFELYLKSNTFKQSIPAAQIEFIIDAIKAAAPNDHAMYFNTLFSRIKEINSKVKINGDATKLKAVVLTALKSDAGITLEFLATNHYQNLYRNEKIIFLNDVIPHNITFDVKLFGYFGYIEQLNKLGTRTSYRNLFDKALDAVKNDQGMALAFLDTQYYKGFSIDRKIKFLGDMIKNHKLALTNETIAAKISVLEQEQNKNTLKAMSQINLLHNNGLISDSDAEKSKLTNEQMRVASIVKLYRAGLIGGIKELFDKYAPSVEDTNRLTVVEYLSLLGELKKKDLINLRDYNALIAADKETAKCVINQIDHRVTPDKFIPVFVKALEHNTFDAKLFNERAAENVIKALLFLENEIKALEKKKDDKSPLELAQFQSIKTKLLAKIDDDMKAKIKKHVLKTSGGRSIFSLKALSRTDLIYLGECGVITKDTISECLWRLLNEYETDSIAKEETIKIEGFKEQLSLVDDLKERLSNADKLMPNYMNIISGYRRGGITNGDIVALLSPDKDRNSKLPIQNMTKLKDLYIKLKSALSENIDLETKQWIEKGINSIESLIKLDDSFIYLEKTMDEAISTNKLSAWCNEQDKKVWTEFKKVAPECIQKKMDEIFPIKVNFSLIHEDNNDKIIVNLSPANQEATIVREQSAIIKTQQPQSTVVSNDNDNENKVKKNSKNENPRAAVIVENKQPQLNIENKSDGENNVALLKAKHIALTKDLAESKKELQDLQNELQKLKNKPQISIEGDDLDTQRKNKETQITNKKAQIANIINQLQLSEGKKEKLSDNAIEKAKREKKDPNYNMFFKSQARPTMPKKDTLIDIPVQSDCETSENNL